MTVATYKADCVSVVQAQVRKLGIIISRTDPYFDRIMTACMAAELSYLDIFKQREGRLGRLDHPHPDTVEGPWRQAPVNQTSQVSIAAATQSDARPTRAETIPSGKTLADCREKWIETRKKVKKCPSADNSRQLRQFSQGGSGSSGLGFRRLASDAASVCV